MEVTFCRKNRAICKVRSLECPVLTDKGDGYLTHAMMDLVPASAICDLHPGERAEATEPSGRFAMNKA
jgi:hypothetical protein